MLKKVVSIVALATMVFASGVYAAHTMFTDVPDGVWYENSVHWVSDTGLMVGNNNRFRPGDPMNRAELATVMQRFYNYAEANLGNDDEDDGTFLTILSGDNEVPPVVTDASGACAGTLDNNTLTYACTVSDITVSAAHFHEGDVDENGDIVHTITFDDGEAAGTWTNISAANRAKLISGDIYINVHTTENPDGEIRGQVMVE